MGSASSSTPPPAGGGVELDAEPISVEVLYSVALPEEGEPGFLMLVAPADETIHTNWQERKEDLESWLAFRCVQACTQRKASQLSRSSLRSCQFV